jgi:hypothetical protein
MVIVNGKGFRDEYLETFRYINGQFFKQVFYFNYNITL